MTGWPRTVHGPGRFTQENENGLSLGGASANLGGLATIEMWLRTSDSEGSIIAKRTKSVHWMQPMRGFEFRASLDITFRFSRNWTMHRMQPLCYSADPSFQI